MPLGQTQLMVWTAPSKKHEKIHKKTHFLIFLGRGYRASSSFFFTRLFFLFEVGGCRAFGKPRGRIRFVKSRARGCQANQNRGRGGKLWTAKAVKSGGDQERSSEPR